MISDITIMAYSLALLAGLALEHRLRVGGAWRWCAAKWLALKAWRVDDDWDAEMRAWECYDGEPEPKPRKPRRKRKPAK